MFNQADPSRGNEAASELTQVADAADQLPTRITLPSDVDGETLPSPSPTAAPTPTNTPIPDFHVVEEGETLTTIGAIYGVDPDDIAAKNDISDPNKILVGAAIATPRSWGGLTRSPNRSDRFGDIHRSGRRYAIRSFPGVRCLHRGPDGNQQYRKPEQALCRAPPYDS
jgi:LysM repeat protein